MKQFFLNLFFPDGIECVLCDRLIDQKHDFLCTACYAKLDYVIGKSCDGCGKSLPQTFDGYYCAECMGRELLHVHGIACVTYDDFAAELIWKFKYHNKRYIGRMMGSSMADVLKATFIEDVDCVVPVPIHKEKEKLKGYNHSAILAREIGECCGLKVYEDLLIRSRSTRPLKDLTKDERIKELEGAFDVKAEYKVLAAIDKRILLVDDIFTTGTTVRECCAALVDSGFDNIIVMTYATGVL